jgi:uncharacterized membrane protein
MSGGGRVERATIEERIEMYNTSRNGSPTSLGIDERWERVLCYVGIWVSGIIMLLLEQRNANVRRHAKQSIAVFGVLSLLAWVVGIFGGMLGWIPVLGFFFGAGFGLIHGLIILVMVVLWLVLMALAFMSPRTHILSTEP